MKCPFLQLHYFLLPVPCHLAVEVHPQADVCIELEGETAYDVAPVSVAVGSSSLTISLAFAQGQLFSAVIHPLGDVAG